MGAVTVPASRGSLRKGAASKWAVGLQPRQATRLREGPPSPPRHRESPSARTHENTAPRMLPLTGLQLPASCVLRQTNRTGQVTCISKAERSYARTTQASRSLNRTEASSSPATGRPARQSGGAGSSSSVSAHSGCRPRLPEGPGHTPRRRVRASAPVRLARVLGSWETRLFLGPLHPTTGGVVLPRKRGAVQGPALPNPAAPPEGGVRTASPQSPFPAASGRQPGRRSQERCWKSLCAPGRRRQRGPRV